MQRLTRSRCLYAALLFTLSAQAVAGSFTYRGHLLDEGKPAEGRFDMQIALYANATGTQKLAETVDLVAVEVNEGRFAVALDTPVLAVETAWLEVSVRPSDELSYWPLGAREAVSLKAGTCPAAWELTGNAGTQPNLNFVGTTDNQPLQLGANNRVAAIFRVDTTDPLDNKATVQLGAPTNFMALDARNSTLGGGGRNKVLDTGATVAGGENNSAGSTTGAPFDGSWAAVCGGNGNRAEGTTSTVAGGSQNLAMGPSATVGGGGLNDALALHATVAGGVSNIAFAQSSTVGGGSNNQAYGVAATVAGGTSNSANGSDSFAIGRASCAGGGGSFALGTRAKVRHGTNTAAGSTCNSPSGNSGGDIGSFVWADSQDLDFVSAGEDQFMIRARGGVGINRAPIDGAVELMVAADADNSDVANLWLKERDSNNGILFSAGNASTTINNNAELFIDHYNGTTISRRLELRNTGEVIIRSNITGANAGVSMAANAGSWSSLSDRRLKTAISAIDPIAVLDRLIAIPISEWSYIAQGAAVRHIGPMAQDFAAAFAVGENDTTISTVDADGVALAAIQGLNAKLERENAALRGELDALRRTVEQIAARGEQ